MWNKGDESLVRRVRFLLIFVGERFDRMVGLGLGGAQGQEERLILETPVAIIINSVVLAASLYCVLTT